MMYPFNRISLWWNARSQSAPSEPLIQPLHDNPSPAALRSGYTLLDRHPLGPLKRDFLRDPKIHPHTAIPPLSPYQVSQQLQTWLREPDISIQERNERLQIKALLQQQLSTGEIVLQDLRYITALPQCSHLQRLILHRCRRLQRLPKQLIIEQQMTIASCPALQSLGEKLLVHGTCHISHCEQLVHLPNLLMVHGDTKIEHCPKLSFIHQGCRLTHHVTISHCSLRQGISPHALFAGHLHLINNRHLKELPSRFACGQDLYIAHCISLSALGEGISIGGDLTIEQAPKLRQLPSHFHLGHALRLVHVGIVALPPCLANIRGTLELLHCPELKSLPKQMHILGATRIHYATALPSLPETLLCQGPMDVSHNRLLQTLPVRWTFQTCLNLSHCPQITYLPYQLQELAAQHPANLPPLTIVLHGIHLQWNNYWQWADWLALQSQEHLNMRLDFHPTSHLDNGFEPLQRLWQFVGGPSPQRWSTICPQFQQQQLIYRYVRKLCQSNDYRQPRSKAHLCQRIGQLQSMVKAPDYGTVVLGVMEAYLSSCSDGIMRSLDEIEQGYLVHQITTRPYNEQQLYRLGLRLFRLARVRSYAMAHVANLHQWQQSDVDATEYCLAYEIQLAEPLDLPIQTHSMLYGADVFPHHIQEVKDYVLRDCQDKRLINTFFATWHPWQRHLRKNLCHLLRYGKLPVHEQLPTMEDVVCPFTQELICHSKQPVCILDDNHGLWCEYAAWQIWWIEHGTHPISKIKISHKQWFRPLKR